MYKKIYDEMEETKILESLDNVTKNIEANHGNIAIQKTKQWEAKLKEWAKLLGDEEAGGGGGGGGGGTGRGTPGGNGGPGVCLIAMGFRPGAHKALP